MDERTADKIIGATYWPRMAGASALGLLALFLLFATLSELRSYQYIGSGVTATNTLAVSGSGEVFAVPDIATFSVTVQETAKDVKTAQDTATKKSNDIVAYLKQQGIEDKDVQTSDYSIYPQYDYSTPQACPMGSYCPSRQTIIGYQVSQTLTVKVRDTSKAGTILAGVGGKGVSNVSGLSLEVSNQEALGNQARDKAIQDAKAKAEVLAKSLGVSLVRIVGYTEGGGDYRVYSAKAVGMGASDSAQPAPALPAGQNKIASNVTVTYEIR